MSILSVMVSHILWLPRDLAWHDLAFYNVDLYEGMRRMMLDAQEGSKSREEFLSAYCCYFEVGTKKIHVMRGRKKSYLTSNLSVKIDLNWGKKKNSHLAGLEPATFRLTAERANRLRHRCCCDNVFVYKGK